MESSDECDNARVFEGARVHIHSVLKDYSAVFGNAVLNEAVLYGNSVVYDKAYVGKMMFLRSVEVCGNSVVTGETFISNSRIG